MKLLGDEDVATYEAVRDHILSYGSEAREWLLRHARSADPVSRRRVQEIVESLGRRHADDRFLAFCLNQGEDFDLEEGVWLLAMTRYPEINLAAYQALLDSHSGDLRERLDFGDPPARLLEGFGRYLFEELGYRGNEEEYYDPENSYLNRVMDRRTGNPISLCTLFLLLARRLRLPVAGIGMPGHFICRFQSPTAEIFVDVFNRGRLMSKADCMRYLVQSTYGFHEGYLAPATPRRMLLRMCSNLHQIHVHLKQPDETARLQRYIVALAK